MQIWPIAALALIALIAYDFMFGKDKERRWFMTAAFWVLFSVLLLSLPRCGSCKGCDPEGGPVIPYSF